MRRSPRPLLPLLARLLGVIALISPACAPQGHASRKVGDTGTELDGAADAAAGADASGQGPSDASSPAADDAGDSGEADAGVAPPCASCGDGRHTLEDGWKLQASSSVLASGEDISSAGFTTDGWYAVRVPSTVFAALVESGVYPDPYYGDNLTQASPFIRLSSWWYRTEFTLASDFGPAVFLALDGINYRANVWLNGQQIATSDQVVGTFTAYEWNVSSQLRAGVNTLAIEVFPPDLNNDLAVTWFDWNPAPPDADMGVWQSVYLRKSGPVALRDAHVQSELSADHESAALTIKAKLVNTTDQAVHAELRAKIEQLDVSQGFELAPNETKAVRLDSKSVPALTLQKPRLWWPAQMGSPELHQLTLEAKVGDSISDSQTFQFGIRSVSATLTADGYRLYTVNGKRVLIRGGGWASDMLLRQDQEHLEAQFQYVRDLGLNAIRLEGKLESDSFYETADRYGIMVLAGYMCCDHWQDWPDWSDEDHQVAAASTATQARRLRNHPSVIDFLIGSDEAPPPAVERELLAAFEAADWPNPICASAADRSTPTLGPSGMKMNGPYDWIAPSYWLLDSEHGGAFGFSSEVGPGPAIPELETLQAMLSPDEQDSLWTQLGDQQFHAGTNGIMYNFGQLSLFNQALSARHGPPTSLADYVQKAQLMGYEGERAPFEAYGRNKYRSATGIVHWLLNNAWPSLIWHLYAYDLSAAGGYFGAKKGNEPLHIMYSYDDRSVAVLNHTQRDALGLTAQVSVYNLDATQVFTKTVPVDVAADSVSRALTIPELDGLSATYFVALRLARGDRVVSDNFYWLSRAPEQIDLNGSDWFHAPTLSFADYTALASLPQVKLEVSLSSTRGSGPDAVGETSVTLKNPSHDLAFFTRLELTAGKSGSAVWPVLWQDNYVSLLPGEQRTLKVRYAVSRLAGKRPAVAVSGFNQPQQIVSD